MAYNRRYQKNVKYKNMNIAFIQARMSSTRLAEKVLLPLNNKTVLETVYDRVKQSKLIDDIYIVTSIDKSNKKLINFCINKNMNIFIGSEDDVLDRFYQLAKLLKIKNIVRITADCPLIDAEIIDKVIVEHINRHNDYTSNTIIPTYPDGLDVEIFTFDTLYNTWLNAHLMSEREHVTPYMKNNIIFKKYNVENNINLSKYRLTLDQIEDYELIKKIYFFGEDNLLLNEVINIIDNNKLFNLNSHIKRNEGYINSLKNDFYV